MSRFAFYHDAALTTQVTAGNPLSFVQVAAGTKDASCYLGEPAAGFILEDETNPGVDPVEVSISDAAVGSLIEAADITLALDPGDLGTNTPGAALAVGVQVLSQAAGAVQIHVRVDNSALAAGQTDAGNLALALTGAAWREA
jgi:hypothetical protein